MQSLSMKSAFMKAPPALRNDIRCALIVLVCGTIGLIVDFNTVLFNLGLFYGAIALFLTRYLRQRLVERKSTALDIYPAIVGTIIPSLTIVILFLIRSDATNFCMGIFLGIAFYNGLYLGLNKTSQQ